MEHSELIFPSKQAAMEACGAAFDRHDAPQRECMQVEITPVLPEDPDNPGSIPCDETDPNWKGDWCVFGTDAENNSWAVANDSLNWECLS